MASINLSGVLREPLGEASSGNKIVFTHVSTTGEVIAGSSTRYTVAVGGAYDIDIEYGNVNVMTSDLLSSSWQNHGTMTINQDTTATTLPTLLNSAVPPTDDKIILFQDLVKEATDARDASEASAVRAETAAQTSIDNTILMTASERDAILAANEEKYAASGMVHMGKHFSDATRHNINDGIWSSPTNTNALRVGRGGGSASGESKTNFPVTHIAGCISRILSVNLPDSSYDSVESFILLPPAPRGYDIHDSTGDARGTGKATLNLRTEIDPKYGDIASTDNEAAGRSFEGNVKNGDFRLGDNGDWLLYSGATVTVGSATLPPAAYISSSAVDDNDNWHDVEVSLVSIGANSQVRIRIGNSAGATDDTQVYVGLAQDEQVIVRARLKRNLTNNLIISNTSGVGVITVNSAHLKLETEEVVTDRVDMFGLEQFDMVIKDDEIFDMVQSQSATFGDTDVPTVDSVRPDSFFAVYDGQTGITKGKCVKWSTLTDVQKRKVAEYMKERLWINEDGDLTFTTIRQRSFAGAGNGDWSNVNAKGKFGSDAHNGMLRFDTATNSYVNPQGDNDSAPAYSDASRRYKGYNDSPFTGLSAGAFVAADGNNQSSRAYKGRCFFYVLGTVSRLNQGAYHPQLNAAGAATFVNASSGAATGRVNWYDSNITATPTKADCFNYVSLSQTGLVAGGAYCADWSGYISAGVSGRSDGRFYDAIYADGEGGVVDYRLSAYDMSSPEESAKAWEKVKNGTYRGLENLVWTEASAGVTATSGGTSNDAYVIHSSTSLTNISVGDIGYFKQDSWSVTGFIKVKVASLAGGNIYIRGVDVDIPNTQGGQSVTLVMSRELNTSVSGNFTNEVVFADPVYLLACDAYKNGWQGVWGGIPNGSAMNCVRKVIGSTQLTAVQSVAPYTDFATITGVNETVLNETPIPLLTDVIYAYPMTNFAKQTKPSTNKPVLNGEAGVGAMNTLNYNTVDYGVLLAESLIESVLTNSLSTSQLTASYKLNTFEIYSGSGVIDHNAGRKPTHAPLALPTPTNNSHAVKALPYQISDNGQCSIGVQANELTYGSPTITDVSDQTVVAAVQYGLYKITDTASLLFGKVIRRIGGDNTVNLTGYYIQDGKVYSPSNNYDPVWGVWSGNGWGDDSTLVITADGSDTFIDLNGNTNLSVSHELAMQIGWTHNHARVSTQVAGVDL